jgi:hypothetical protein
MSGGTRDATRGQPFDADRALDSASSGSRDAIGTTGATGAIGAPGAIGATPPIPETESRVSPPTEHDVPGGAGDLPLAEWSVLDPHELALLATLGC